MDVIKQFKRFVFDNQLVNQGDKVLLAVSGGKDSMMMLWLFLQANISVEIAHCNFNLRGDESDGDENLVKDFARKYDIPFHVKRFDTERYALEHKMSIQMAARELRYDWFEELRKERACESIAIAQHKNDHVETVLFNLSRGTGLKGLSGIRDIRNYIIRPLLFLDSNCISKFVLDNKIPYRDDSSNFSNKYARNKLRLDIIPEFEKLNEDFIQIMDENISRFQESTEVLTDFVDELRSQVFVENGKDSWEISKAVLSTKKIGLIYFLFEPFHFSKSVLEDMISSLTKESGRIFESDEYVILSDRDNLILRHKAIDTNSVSIEAINIEEWQWGSFEFEATVSEDCTIEKDNCSVKIDVDKLVYPLTIRSWEKGDIFQPLGMNGKKKVSDFFIQRKINIFQKEEIPILCNGNGDIIWIVEQQLDDRYKITQKTKKVLKLVVHKR